MSVRAAHRERGFALIAALFLLVVLAALGAFAVHINMTQRHTSTLELQELRARAALHAGIEYAAARLLSTGDCNGVRDIPGMPGNFAVTFANCIGRDYDINGVTVTIYTLDVTATNGAAYGTPEFVVRAARDVRVTT